MYSNNLPFRSCDATRLYDDRSFPESAEDLLVLTDRAPAGEYICSLFPAYEYERIFDESSLYTSEAFKAELSNNRKIIQNNKSGASSAVFKLNNVVIRDRIIYVKDDSGYSIVYETFRPCDRHDSKLAVADELAGAPAGSAVEDICLFIGSTGCFNYGHWLSDDLVKISAFWLLRQLHPNRHITVIIAAHNTGIDAIKKESIELLLSADTNFSIKVFARPISVFFTNLYYASPTSLPGALKSPEAVGHLHAAAIEALMRRKPAAIKGYMNADKKNGTRIFVDRGPGHSRELRNSVEIFSKLREIGFDYVIPENLSFIDQVETFSKASVIVGNMGAGMTNTIFSRPNSSVLYLAPEGWDDAFFWDLACVMNQNHGAIYGSPLTPDLSFGYQVDPQVVVRVLQDRFL